MTLRQRRRPRAQNKNAGAVAPAIAPPGLEPSNLPFKVTIQRFGGAGVGHWTLAIPDGAGGWFTVCFETLTSGQIVIRYA
jgi:hypothetical protein